MNDRFAPINVGKVLPPPTHIPAPQPQLLKLARSMPDYEGMDDMADYAQTVLRPHPFQGEAQ